MTRWRVCLGYPTGTQCGRLTTSARCPDCERRYQAGRNAARGDHRARHARARRHWQPIVERGEVQCARCGQVIAPGQAWDVDELQVDTFHPSHASCNRSAGARQARRHR